MIKIYFLIIGLLGAILSGNWILIPLGLLAVAVVAVCQKSNAYTSRKMAKSRNPISILWWMFIGLFVIVASLGIFLFGLGGLLVMTK